jgi:hypothetical protein
MMMVLSCSLAVSPGLTTTSILAIRERRRPIKKKKGESCLLKNTRLTLTGTKLNEPLRDFVPGFYVVTSHPKKYQW